MVVGSARVAVCTSSMLYHFHYDMDAVIVHNDAGFPIVAGSDSPVGEGCMESQFCTGKCHTFSCACGH